MSLLNRPTTTRKLYDEEGYLIRGWRAADELAEALSSGPIEEDDRDLRPPFSPPTSRFSNTAASSPIDMPLSYSGASTPSVSGSLDSESGILTRVEAKELKDLLNSHENNPFDDPDAGDILVSRTTAGIDLETDVTLRRRNSYPVISNIEVRTVTRTGANGLCSNSVAPLATGPLLKRRFIQFGVIETMLVS